jgi:chromosome segregation ATPase
MANNLSASEQIEELQQKIERLKHQSVLELRVKLAEARRAVVEIEEQIAKLTGKEAPAAGRRTRTSITIEQVVAAIKSGANNYKKIAAKLGCSPITVANKIQAEGKGKGISSTGRKASFKLVVK